MTTTDEQRDTPRVVVWDILEVAEPIDERRRFGLVTHQGQLAAEIEAEELTDWLAIAEPTFDFWDNEADDAYNEL